MNQNTLVIEPPKGIIKFINFREVWNFKELLWILTWRDIKVRYKQAVLGVAWAVIQPVFTVLTFSVLFGKLAKIPSDGLPYPLFSFAALLPWVYFTTALSRGTQSLVSGGSLLSKVYFPRVLIPLSCVLSALIDYAISFALLIMVMFYYGFPPTLSWFLAIPLLTACLVTFAFGASLWLSSLNVRYRDVGHLIPFLLQIWMFATPVVYPLNMIPEKYQLIARLNPLAGIISAFRTLALGQATDLNAILYGLITTVVILVTGLMYFSKTEKSFADVV